MTITTLLWLLGIGALFSFFLMRRRGGGMHGDHSHGRDGGRRASEDAEPRDRPHRHGGGCC